jgi:hypothetical protein
VEIEYKLKLHGAFKAPAVKAGLHLHSTYSKQVKFSPWLISEFLNDFHKTQILNIWQYFLTSEL